MAWSHHPLLHPAPHPKFEPRFAFGKESKACFITPSSLYAVIYSVLHPAVKSCSAFARVSKWSFSHVHERLMSCEAKVQKDQPPPSSKAYSLSGKNQRKANPHLRGRATPCKAKGKEIKLPHYATEIQKFSAVDYVLRRLDSI